MTVVIEQGEYGSLYDNIISVGHALTWLGFEVKIWDSKAIPFLDMKHDLKPEVIIYCSKLNDRLKDDSSVKLIQADRFNRVISNPILFKKNAVSPLFKTDQVCILQYPDIENPEDNVLRWKMSTKNEFGFRLFSPVNIGGASFCGWIQKEYHTLIFSSAKSVLALSEATAINARLCNDNVTISRNGKEEVYRVSKEDILKNSCLIAAGEVVSLTKELNDKIEAFHAGI